VFNTNAGSYTIGAGGADGTLTLDNTGGVGPATVTVSAGSHTIVASVAIPNGATISTAADPSPTSPALTISGAISGNGGLAKTGTGTLRLSSTNGYLGGTTISNGTLDFIWAGGGAFGPAPVGGSIVNNAALIITRNTADAAFKGIITGAGTTTINGDGGNLKLGVAGDAVARLSGQSDLTVSIGLDLNGNSQTIGGLNGTGTITSNSGLSLPVSLTIGNNGDGGTFSGGIANVGETLSLIKAGAGTEILAAQSSYTGGTTVSGGTLRTSANNALGSGSLTANATVILGGNESIGTLSGTGSVSVAASKTLTVNPSADAGFSGGLTLNAAAEPSNPSLALTGSHTLALTGSATLNTGSIISVGDGTNAGTLRMNMASNSTVGTAVSATVAVNATLELDGTKSALQDSTVSLNRAAIANNGTLAVGNATVAPMGTTQQVGGIDGSGSVVVGDSVAASLTADHINQMSLVIGAGSTFTLAPSAADGSPMVGQGAGSSLVLAGSLTPSTSFIGAIGSLLGIGSASSAPAVSLGGGLGGASVSAVPEPSAVLLLLLGGMGAWSLVRRRKSSG